MFREKCDENSYIYLYIDQNVDKYSSKIYKDRSKRPDNIMSVPHLGSIFVDVKAYKEQLFYADALRKKDLRVPKSFWLKRDEILQFIILQEETSMKVWFAVIPTKDNIPLNETHFLPVDVALKFMSERHRNQPEWKYVQIPIDCFKECGRLAKNQCGNCKNQYCNND